ncbi:hypothetical protein L7F22_050570 [Adiantum nelumboides]|nr:hypothetical protein [Adiantum nelumboides]
MNFEDAFERRDMHVVGVDLGIELVDDIAANDAVDVAVTMVDDDGVIIFEDGDADEAAADDTACDDENGTVLYADMVGLLACEWDEDGDDDDDDDGGGVKVSVADEEGETVDDEDDKSDTSPEDNDSIEDGDDGKDIVVEDKVCDRGIESDTGTEVFFMDDKVEKLFALIKDGERLSDDERGEVMQEDAVSLLKGSAVGVSSEARAVDNKVGDALTEIVDDKADDVDGVCNSVLADEDDKLNFFMDEGSLSTDDEDIEVGLNAHE